MLLDGFAQEAQTLSVLALWVDEYRTGSGSDLVGLVINKSSISWIAENSSLE